MAWIAGALSMRPSAEDEGEKKNGKFWMEHVCFHLSARRLGQRAGEASLAGADCVVYAGMVVPLQFGRGEVV